MIEQLVINELDNYKKDIESIGEKKIIDCITIFSSSEEDYLRLNNELKDNKLIDKMTSGNLYYLGKYADMFEGRKADSFKDVYKDMGKAMKLIKKSIGTESVVEKGVIKTR